MLKATGNNTQPNLNSYEIPENQIPINKLRAQDVSVQAGTLSVQIDGQLDEENEPKPSTSKTCVKKSQTLKKKLRPLPKAAPEKEVENTRGNVSL